MEEKEVASSCPKCKNPTMASHKFCPTCGRRLGFGTRSENEIRAGMAELLGWEIGPTASDPRFIMANIAMAIHALKWTLGEVDKSPMALIKRTTRPFTFGGM